MGLRMDDIHAPTVAASSAANGTSNGPAEDKPTLQELIQQRDKLEKELLALSDILDNHKVNMNTPLVTPDGFPRSDIDVAQIRTIRSRVIHLKNDRKDLMAQIEQGLHEHHAKLQAQAPLASSSSGSSAAATQSSAQVTPAVAPAFAKVNSVSPGSPAETAGLKANDKVVTFGTADWLNHEKLARIAEIVSQNEGRPITVSIIRGDPTAGAVDAVRLTLTPRRGWGGRGLLGCHLVPL